MLVADGNEVLVCSGAGFKAGFDDDDYAKAGAFMGLWAMMSNHGGSGKFASGLAGAPSVRAIVCGCGIVGKAAIEVLMNMGCQMTVADVNVGVLRDISSKYSCESG